MSAGSRSRRPRLVPLLAAIVAVSPLAAGAPVQGQVQTALERLKELVHQFEHLKQQKHRRRVLRLQNAGFEMPADLQDANLRIRFLGPAVDLELGTLLAHLAETRPQLLNPQPIDWRFVDKQCVNRFIFPPVLPEKISGKEADALLRAMLHESREYVPREAGGPLKYTVVKSTVTRYNSLGVGPHLEASDAGIRALDLDSSLTIVDAVMRSEYRLAGVHDAHLAGFLRNAGAIARDSTSLKKAIQRAARVEADGIFGPETLHAINSTESGRLWRRLYRELAWAKSCRDANNIYRAYGIAYRGADYPLARRTFLSLRDNGYPNHVPVVRLREISAPRIEAVEPDCKLFGPVQYARDCVTNTIEVDDEQRFVSIAGGVELPLNVDVHERDELVQELTAVLNQRQAVDRRRAAVLVDRELVTNTVTSADRTRADPDERYLPCVEFHSSAKRHEIEGLKKHIRFYKRKYYPLYKHGSKLYPQVELFDYFPVDSEIIDDLAELVESLPPLPTSEHTFCEQMDKYLEEFDEEYVEALRKMTHGPFVRSLLVGGEAPIADVGHIGLLTFEGAQSDWEIVSVEDTRRLPMLIDRFGNSHERNANFLYWSETNPQFTENHLAVINVSLSNVLHRKEEIQELREPILALSSSGLVVAASGSKANLQLERSDAPLNLDQALKTDGKFCNVYPACFSYLPNVITVGAIRNDPEFGPNAIPQLMSEVYSGTAVTVVAPGLGILSNESHYFAGEDIEKRVSFGVRNGASLASVFVSALGAEMIARFGSLGVRETKARIIATSGPYLSSKGERELLLGPRGEVLAGVIDVDMALRNPKSHYVRMRNGEVREYDDIEFGFKKKRRMFLFGSTSNTSQGIFSCKWDDLLRIHIYGSQDKDDRNRDIFSASVVCWADGDRLHIGKGYLGTKNNQEDACIPDGTCFSAWPARADGEILDADRRENLDFASVRDIYFRTSR